MFIKIMLSYVLGYLKLSVEGYYIERFINICKNIVFWTSQYFYRTQISIFEFTEEPAEIPALVETSTDSTQSESNQTTDTNLSSSEAAAKEEIAQRESSGSYTAQNGQYYGRYQLSSSYLNGDFSPANQEKVADNYVASRYGSWTAALAFWNANGWY